MKMASKKEVIIQALRESRASYEITNAIDLMNLLVDDAKERLTNCTPDEVRSIQGEIRGYRALERALKRPDITPKE